MAKLRGFAFGVALLACAAPAAQAKSQFVTFEGANASQTIAPLTKNGSIVVLGQVPGAAGAISHAIEFVSNVENVVMTANWVVNTAASDIRTVGVNIDLISGGSIVASDTFSGLLGGVAVSTMTASGLVKGQTYRLLLTGNGVGQGASTYTITLEPQ